MIDYEPPEIKQAINKIEYRFPEMELLISAEKIESEGIAELWIYHSNGTGNELLKISKVNLLADRSMASLGNSLKQNSSDIPWPQVLTSITKNTLQIQRHGDPGTLIKPITDDIKHPGYYLEPVVIKGLPTILYGNKGVNKTTLCLMMMGIIGIGDTYSPSGLTAPEHGNIGMLDWESSHDMTTYNISRLVEGGTVPYFEMPYLKCRRKLIDEIDRIVAWKNQNNVDIVLIDSLGQAAGSEKFDSSGKEAALKFFEALNQLNVTSLIIGQNAKGEEGKKSVYGSTYFEYYARNIFELIDTNSSLDKDIKIVALRHANSNYSGLYDPIGFKVSYTKSTILIESQIVSLTQLKGKLADSEAIIDYLKSEGRLLSIKEIATAIQKTENQVGVVLNGLKKRNIVVNPERGKWGLSYNES